MIRLYLDQDFETGSRLKIPKEEVHYLHVNRHASKGAHGELEAFNSKGKIARGILDDGFFYVESVVDSPFPIYPITVALALPENAALESVVRSASELGAERMILFEGDRSQSARSRMAGVHKRAERIAKESMRQSVRPRPLVIEMAKKLESLKFSGTIFFLDEMDEDSFDRAPKNRGSEVVIVGPEGGWSPRERELSRERGWTIRHYKTPILRVVTAVPVAVFDVIREKF